MTSRAFPFLSAFRSRVLFKPIVAVALVACAAFSFADDAVSPKLARRLAALERLEKQEDWDEALEYAERIYETLPTDDATRRLLRGKFDVLRQK